MELKSKTGIHLHAAVRRRQRSPGRHLQHVRKGEPGSVPGGSLWKLRCAMVTSSTQLRRFCGLRGIADVAIAVGRALPWDGQVVRARWRSARSFNFCARVEAAPPSMIAMRLPTGLWLGSARANPAAPRGCDLDRSPALRRSTRRPGSRGLARLKEYEWSPSPRR